MVATTALRRPRNHGFTLVEVLIALAVMALSVTSVLALFAAATATHKRAIDRTNATLLADSVLTEIRSAFTGSFGNADTKSSSGGVYTWKDQATHAAFADMRYDVYLTPLDATDLDTANTVHVEVVVGWLRAGKRQHDTHHSVMVRRVRLRDFD